MRKIGDSVKRGVLLTFLLLLTGCSVKAKKPQINVAIASSMYEVTQEIKKKYQEINPELDIVLHSASSGSLRRQIELGADIDIFISASIPHMDKLKEEGYLLNNAYQPLVKNRLVLITSYDNDRIQTLIDIVGNESLIFAMGEPESVPAGAYAKDVLEYYAFDKAILAKTVLAKDVKEVLTWVSLGEVDAGVVYRTDALLEKKVKIVEVFDEVSHQAIIYPIARLKTSESKKDVEPFEDFLLSEKAQEIFKSYGFSIID